MSVVVNFSFMVSGIILVEYHRKLLMMVIIMCVAVCVMKGEWDWCMLLMRYEMSAYDGLFREYF